MSDSFSLAIEPVHNIKTIKQYETQIENLQSENFELKHQLSYYRNHANVPKEEQLLKFQKIEKELLEQTEYVKKQDKIIANYKEIEEKYNNQGIKYQHLCEELQKKEVELLNLTKKNNYQLNEMQTKLNAANNLNNTLSNSIESNIKRITYLEKSLGDSQQHIRTLRKENDENISNHQNNDNKITFLDKVVTEQATSISNLENINHKLRNQISQFSSEKEQYDSRVNTLSNEKHQLRLQNEQLNKEIIELQSHLKNIQFSSDLKFSESHLEKQSLKKILDETDNEIKNKNNEISILKEKLQNDYNKYNNIKKEYENIISKYNLLKEESFRIHEEKKDLKNEYDNLQRLYLNIKQDFETLNNEYTINKNTLNASKSHSNDLKQKYRDLKTEFEQLKQKKIIFFTQTSLNLEKIHRKIKNLQNKIEKMILKNRNIKNLKKLNIRTSNYNEIISKLFYTIKKLKNKNSSLETEVDDISSFLSKHTDEQTIRLIEEFTKEFELARQDLDQCKNYLEKKGNENKQLKNELKKLRKCHQCI